MLALASKPRSQEGNGTSLPSEKNDEEHVENEKDSDEEEGDDSREAQNGEEANVTACTVSE